MCCIKLKDVINVDIQDIVCEVIWLDLVGPGDCPKLDFCENANKNFKNFLTK